jgi:5-methyltetrahydropteroyltriglutamate--homocysteine methyltransferase
MALVTTTVGAYPKPDYIRSANQTRSGRDGRPRRLAQGIEREKRLSRAAREVVAEQVELGIEIPTTGAVRREHEIYDLCRQLAGIDFSRESGKVLRTGSEEVGVPTVTEPIQYRDHFLLSEWQVAQSASKRPVKITLPGPMTIADALGDLYYEGNDRQLMSDLAKALNTEIHALADAGCAWIQIDEPLFALEPEQAVAFGIDNLEHCFHRVPAPVARVVHLCNGYPTELDSDDDLKAEPAAYFELAEALELSSLQVVSIEDTHQPNDFALLEQFISTRVILGVVAGFKTEVELIEEITSRLRQALYHIEPSRLLVAPDSHLQMLDRRLAVSKLTNMVIAAQAVG